MTAEIMQRAREEEADLVRFLRDIVAIPSPSGGEEAVVRRIAAEMEACGFDEVKFDGLGNVLGRVGDGPRVLAFDAHIDTVGVGDRDQWCCDPYAGKLEDGEIYGRGAVDQKAGMAAMVRAGRLIRELGLARDFQVWMVGSVQEEDSDGLCWHYILEEKVLAPELVVSTEPTDLKIHRGQRGRMEILVTAHGRSCHGSMPHLGDNAVAKLAPAVAAIEAMGGRLADDPFLGRGTACVTWFGCRTPSMNAVPFEASLMIDRRLTEGETLESSLAEVRAALADAGVTADVEVPLYETASWTGLVYPMRKYYPTWTVPADHPAVRAAVAAGSELFGAAPAVDRWTFSTNGVAINGLHGVPCIGFGPGREDLAHQRDERVPVDDLVRACAMYAALPGALARTAP